MEAHKNRRIEEWSSARDNLEFKEDSKISSIEDMVARETALFLEQQKCLSVRDLASRFENGLAVVQRYLMRDWGRRFMRLFPQCTSWDNKKDPERPLVIGYVSPDYFTHSVSYFIEAPLIYHDYANYKVVVYSAVVKENGSTSSVGMVN